MPAELPLTAWGERAKASALICLQRVAAAIGLKRVEELHPEIIAAICSFGLDLGQQRQESADHAAASSMRAPAADDGDTLRAPAFIEDDEAGKYSRRMDEVTRIENIPHVRRRPRAG